MRHVQRNVFCIRRSDLFIFSREEVLSTSIPASFLPLSSGPKWENGLAQILETPLIALSLSLSRHVVSELERLAYCSFPLAVAHIGPIPGRKELPPTFPEKCYCPNFHFISCSPVDSWTGEIRAQTGRQIALKKPARPTGGYLAM